MPSYPKNTFSDFAALLNYINAYWITNGVQEITGVIGNDVVNGLLTFVEQSPLNWQTADIQSGGGVISATRPITVFMGTVPTMVSWGDNIYNEWVFINTTLGNIPTLNPYVDINLQNVFTIPAKSIINICKARNGVWILKSLPASGSGVIVPPLVGTVGDGGPDDPAADSTTFQSNKLKNLGATNGGKITLLYAEVPYSSWGPNKAFDFNNVTGTLTWVNGYKFILKDTLWIDLNQ